MKGRTGLAPATFLAAALAFAACSGTGAVPTPINSLASPAAAAFCAGTSREAIDLETVVKAVAVAAAGSGFTLENASARIDSAVAGLRGLSLTGQQQSARDALATALLQLKGELPTPTANTIYGASQAAITFNALRSSFCG